METRSVTRRKWGDIAANAGFTIVPNHLLAINQFVTEEKRLSPTEMVVLLQILLSWWSADKLPFPSKTTIGRRAGLSPRQAQRALAGLEQKQYLKRIARFSGEKGRTSNTYQLEPLVTLVKQVAASNPDAFHRTAPVMTE